MVKKGFMFFLVLLLAFLWLLVVQLVPLVKHLEKIKR